MRPIFREFLSVLRHRPFKAVEILYWYATRRRVRAAGRFEQAIHQTPRAYDFWIRTREHTAALIAEAPARIERLPNRPLFSIILLRNGGRSSDAFNRVAQSIIDQCYPHWELLPCVAEGQTVDLPQDPRIRDPLFHTTESGSGLKAALDAAVGDFVMPLHGNALLAPTTLLLFAEALNGSNTTAALFGDHDHLDRNARRVDPWFKPEWDEELFLAQNYLSPACAIRIDLAKTAPPNTTDDPACQIYALMLGGLSEFDGVISRVPAVCAHVIAGTGRDTARDRTRIVSDHLRARGADAKPGHFDNVVVHWPLPSRQPTVTIIIPTRDKPDLLRTCVDSILNKTDFDNFDILIVDNLSSEDETHRLFEEYTKNPKVKILPYPHSYNYAAINNVAAVQAQGEYLCLLNNDTEVIDGQWLKEMLRYAVRPEVGAVGAKLLYGDGSIQHAGVVIGLGGAAGHAHRGLPDDKPGYFAQAHVAHFATAVTAACLLVEKRKYLDVGGMDQDGFKIAYNDVDFCLKLRAAGWKNVYAPQSVLVHYESKSRGTDFAPEQIERYRQELSLLQTRWQTRSFLDPMHHPSLDRSVEQYRTRFTPQIVLDDQ